MRSRQTPFLFYIGNNGGRRIHPIPDDPLAYVTIPGLAALPSPTVVAGDDLLKWETSRYRLTMQAQTAAVKFVYLVKNSQALGIFPLSFTLGLGGLTRQGANLLYNGRVVAELRRPWLRVGTEVRWLGVSWVGNTVTLSLPDLTGLPAPSASAPWEIDPTLDLQVGASAQDAYKPSNGNPSITDVQAPASNAAWGSAAWGAKFTGITIPAGWLLARGRYPS